MAAYDPKASRPSPVVEPTDEAPVETLLEPKAKPTSTVVASPLPAPREPAARLAVVAGVAAAAAIVIVVLRRRSRD